MKNQSQLLNNITSKEITREKKENITMNTYIEQILKFHFVSALKTLSANCEERLFLKKDNNKAHDTHFVKNKMQTYKKKKRIELYINSLVSSDLFIIERV